MRSLREFATFVGQPNSPISPRTLAEYLRLLINPGSVSVREIIQTFEVNSSPVALEAISVEPSSAIVPFQIGMQLTKIKGYVFEVRWRILRNGQQVAVYNVPKVGAGIAQAAHTFSETGTYTVEGMIKGIGSSGYGEATKSATVAAQPKPTPVPTPNPTPPPQTKPNISVDYDGPASSAKFTVTGSGFLKNHTVHIRVVNNFTLQNGFFDATSNSNGAIDHEINFPCESGVKLSFSANDDRSDPSDLTGTLWSNTVTLTVT